jgi:hypothetical protein
MATRNYVEDLEYLDAKGLDTAAPINLMQQGFVREAVNVNLGTTGGYIKRGGYTEQSLIWPPGVSDYIIRGLYQYRNTNLIIQPIRTILFGTKLAGSVFGYIDEFPLLSGYNPDQEPEFKPFKYYQDNGDGTFTETSLTLSSSFRSSFAQIGNALYYFDGSGFFQTPFVYEGNDADFVRPIGISAPTTVPTAQLQNGGALEVGQYLYSYT